MKKADQPDYWMIQIGEAFTKEADTPDEAEKLYKQLCDSSPDEEVVMCGVWIMPIKRRQPSK